MKRNRTPVTVGWKEWVALPELGIPAIKAKIDTGAKTSALHAFKLESYFDAGAECVRFWLHPLQKNKGIEVICEAAVADRRVIRDSGGHEEERAIIATPVWLNGRQWEIEVSLTSRENMSFRMLLGRSAMRRGGLQVDPERAYATGKALYRSFTKTLISKKTRAAS
jgi:hypothetical protein